MAYAAQQVHVDSDEDDEARFEELSSSSSGRPSASSSRLATPELQTLQVHGDDEDEDEAPFHESFDQPSRLQIAQAETLKEQGNVDFKAGKWQQALDRYREAIQCLPVLVQDKGKKKSTDGDNEVDGEPNGDPKVDGGPDGAGEEAQEQEGEETDDDRKMKVLRSILHANVAACLLKMKTWKEAAEYATLGAIRYLLPRSVADDLRQALQDDPLYAKARHRRALANEEIGTWGSLQSSLEDYNLLSTSPAVPASMRPSIESARSRLPAKIAEQSEKEKAEMMGKLKELGNSFLGMFGMSTDNFKMEKGDDGGYRLNVQR